MQPPKKLAKNKQNKFPCRLRNLNFFRLTDRFDFNTPEATMGSTPIWDSQLVWSDGDATGVAPGCDAARWGPTLPTVPAVWASMRLEAFLSPQGVEMMGGFLKPSNLEAMAISHELATENPCKMKLIFQNIGIEG